MGTIVAVHVRYISLYISLPFSAKQRLNVKRPNFALSGELEPHRLLFFFLFLFQIHRCVPDLVS